MFTRVLPEAGAETTTPSHKAAHLAAREAARSQSGHGVLLVCLRDAAEVLLGEVQQLPVLHPCRDRGRRYGPGSRGQGTGSGGSRTGGGPHVRSRWEMAEGRHDIRTGSGKRISRERLCLMGGAGTSRSKSVHHLSPREAAARWAERWVPSRCILPHIKNKTGAPWAPGHLPCFVPLTLPQADAGCYPVGEANERAQRCYCRAVTNSGDVHEEHSGPCKTAHPHLYKGRSLPLEHLGWSALWAARETACQRPRPSFLPSQSSHPSGLNSLTLARLNCPWVTGPMATNHALPSSPFHLPGCQGHKLEKHP